MVYATYTDRYQYYVASVGSGILDRGRLKWRELAEKSESNRNNNRISGIIEYLKYKTKKDVQMVC